MKNLAWPLPGASRTFWIATKDLERCFIPWLISLSWTLPVASWAHVPRNLLQTEPFYPEGGHILRRIGQLYAIEAEAKQACPEELLAVLAALRAKESKPVIDEIRTSLMAERAFPRSALGKAIRCPGPATLSRDVKYPESLGS